MIEPEQSPTPEPEPTVSPTEPSAVGAIAVASGIWQSLHSRWNAILGLEAQIETSRLSLEGQRSELEGMFKQTLGVEDRMNALQNDVAQWNKAKSRVHYALPRVREFIHRANLVLAAPERKRLGEVFEKHIEPQVPFPEMDKTLAEMEHLVKDRQALLAQGNAVMQDCRGIAGEIRNTLGTLQRNAKSNAIRKRAAGRK